MGLFSEAIEGKEETLVHNLDVEHGLWTALRARKVLTDHQLADCESGVSWSFVLVLRKWKERCNVVHRPAPFSDRMSCKATKPGLVLFYILECFNCVVAY